jgi:hypothetical protein
MLFSFLKRKSVETMLEQATAVGISLRPGIERERLWAEHSKSDIESRGFLILFCVMGEAAGVAAPEPVSDDIWYFDTEAISNHGDYVHIVESCCRLTGGDLKFERVTDYVDVANETAFIEVTADGRTERVDLKVNDDWVDAKVFKYLTDRLAAAGSKRHFAAHTPGQDMLLICKTPNEIEAISRTTGLRFQFPIC